MSIRQKIDKERSHKEDGYALCLDKGSVRSGKEVRRTLLSQHNKENKKQIEESINSFTFLTVRIIAYFFPFVKRYLYVLYKN